MHPKKKQKKKNSIFSRTQNFEYPLKVYLNFLNMARVVLRIQIILESRKRSWSKMKMTNKPVADQPPGTPTRVAKKASGGGSKKLQQLLGASESDIDLLLRPAEIVSTQTHRVSV